CGTSFEADIKDEINLSENPEIIEQILNNNFMEFMCPACDKVLKPEYRIRFYNDDLDLMMIPEIERDSLLAGSIEIQSKQVVVGFQELREKFIILKYNYDDKIIELIKLFLLEKTDTKLDIKILFTKKEKEVLIFNIYGLRDGETGISKIPESIYNSISSNLEERLKEPGIEELLSLPYRSVNTISTEVN
ncbi:MAG: hypothetical protein KAR21_20075, partial [Spirochaetales bacterium]|nr:hypothetical protein [Spirochaetales bacterium]